MSACWALARKMQAAIRSRVGPAFKALNLHTLSGHTSRHTPRHTPSHAGIMSGWLPAALSASGCTRPALAGAAVLRPGAPTLVTPPPRRRRRRRRRLLQPRHGLPRLGIVRLCIGGAPEVLQRLVRAAQPLPGPQGAGQGRIPHLSYPHAAINSWSVLCMRDTAPHTCVSWLGPHAGTDYRHRRSHDCSASPTTLQSHVPAPAGHRHDCCSRRLGLARGTLSHRPCQAVQGRVPRGAAAQQRLDVAGLAREHGAAVRLRVGAAPQAQPRQRAVVGRRGQAGVERQCGAVALLRLRRCDTLYGRVGLTSSACAAIIWCQKGCRGERPATGYAHRPATAPCVAEQTACTLAAHTQAEAL